MSNPPPSHLTNLPSVDKDPKNISKNLNGFSYDKQMQKLQNGEKLNERIGIQGNTDYGMQDNQSK